MKKPLRNLVYVTIVWLACLLAWSGFLAWIGDGIDSSVLIPAFATGMVVVLFVSQVCQRWDRPRASLAGFGIGFIPSLMALLIGFLLPKTVDASAGWITLSLWLILPNGISGAIGGYSVSRR